MLNNGYEDQPTDELVYGRCKKCYQIEELNAEDLCLVCEVQENNKYEYIRRTRS